MAIVQSLKGFQAFTPVLRFGKKITAKNAALFFLVHNTDKPPKNGNIMLGVGVRRGTKPAILRNRLKRLLRTCIRMLAREYPLSDVLQNRQIHIVVLWYAVPKHPKQITLHQVYPVVMELWQRTTAILEKTPAQPT